MPLTPSCRRTRPLLLPDKAMVATERPAWQDSAASGRDQDTTDAQLLPDEAAVLAAGQCHCCRWQQNNGPGPVYQSMAAPPGGKPDCIACGKDRPVVAGLGRCCCQTRLWWQKGDSCGQTVPPSDKIAMPPTPSSRLGSPASTVFRSLACGHVTAGHCLISCSGHPLLS
jgi:hypothetical protein